MEAAKFRVVLTGELMAGHDAAEAVSRLAELFRIPVERARALVTGTAVPLKQAFDRARAEKVCSQIGQLGVVCRIEPVETGPVLGLEPQADGIEQESARGDHPDRSPVHPGPASSQHEGIALAVRIRNTANPEMAREADLRREQPEWDDLGDLQLFVGPNSDSYLPRFERFRERAGRFAVTWHWPAFLVPVFWLFYRRLWGWAVLGLITSFLFPLSNLVWGLTAHFIYYRHANAWLQRVRAPRFRLRGGDPQERLVSAGGVSKLAVWVVLALAVGWVALVGGIGSRSTGPVVAESAAGQQTVGQLAALTLTAALWAASHGGDVEPDMARMQQDLKLSDDDLLDGWATRIELEQTPDGLAAVSAGADRLFGTDDDVHILE